jgi:hypothetical protein
VAQFQLLGPAARFFFACEKVSFIGNFWAPFGQGPPGPTAAAVAAAPPPSYCCGSKVIKWTDGEKLN